MMRSLLLTLFSLLLFSAISAQAPRIIETIEYRYDEEPGDYYLSGKQKYTYDEENRKEIIERIWVRWDRSREKWKKQSKTRKSYDNEAGKSSVVREYWKKGEWSIVNTSLKAKEKIEVLNSPSYLESNCSEPEYNYLNQVVKAITGKCRLYETRLEYAQDGRPVSYEKYRIEKDGSLKRSGKGVFVYEQEVTVQKEMNTARAFPNPTTDIVTVTFERGLEATVEWMIVNAMGEQVRSGKEDRVLNEMQFSLSGLPSGLYYVSLNDQIETYTLRINLNEQ